MPSQKKLIQKKPVNQKLNKMIPLPNLIEWRVDPIDVLHRGRVLCMFRTKRTFLPDNLSSLKMRMATVTKHGDLIVYDSKDRGLIINLRDATDVLTECDKYKANKIKYSRSHIKIRMPRGNIHLFVRDESIYQWTSAILESHVNCRPKPFVIIRNEEMKKHGLSMMLSQPKLEPITAVEPSDSPMSPLTSSNSGLITVIERTTNSEDTLIPSVRRGAVPVNTLRCKIESDLDMENWKSEVKLGKPQQPSPSASTNENNIISHFVFHSNAMHTIRTNPAKVKIEPSDEIGQNEGTPVEGPYGVVKNWWIEPLKC